MQDILNVEQVSVEGHFFDDLGADSMVMARFCARVRRRDDLPSVSMTDVYRNPTIRGLAATLVPAPDPVRGADSAIAAVLAELLQTEAVAPDAHFFDDLGADSMVMARFCARLRKREDLPSVSMKDVYRHPTARGLAAALVADPPAAVAAAPEPVPAEAPAPPTTREYVLCAALQLLAFLGYTYLVALVATSAYEWVAGGSDLLGYYLRSVVVGAIGLVALGLLPIVVKWTLIGRWTQTEIRIWSPAYFRFWLVKTLVRTNPLVLMAVGSPLYPLYLRALGARVGRGVVILSKSVPVCTDLLTIGDGTVIRKDSQLAGYHARAGVVRTGPITLGSDVFVGEATVVDIGTAMGDGAQLGHSSSLHTGQSVPAGRSVHGTPARPTDVDHRGVGPAPCGRRRRLAYGVMQLVTALVLYLPLVVGGIDILLARFPQLTGVLTTGALSMASPAFYLDALAVSFVLFSGAILAGLLLVVTVPRVLALAVRPDRTYPLYGFRYSVHRTIARLTNLKFYTYLFGDSSYIVGYLRGIGYDLPRTVQTGSNFGTGVKHETPFLATIGSGTMVADGLSVVNAEFSSTSFRVSRTTIGARNFLGNRIAYPIGGRTGDNCLLATKVMVPLDGPVRENVGLLGSPSFEIPRTVERDGRFDHLESGIENAVRLSRKNRYNLRSIGLALLVRWMHVFGLTILAMTAAEFYARLGAVALAAEIVGALVLTMGYYVLVERAIARFRPLRPRFCSIYDPYFWWHERFWKLVIPELDRILAGTPFKNVVSRLLGVRIGARVFDDGCFLPERTLVSIGDDCILNAGTVIQSHSQEDGAFKSDHSRLGARVTLGVGAFVHYGVSVGDGAELGPDSFLMKGEQVPPGARWEGNPAGEARVSRPLPAPPG